MPEGFRHLLLSVSYEVVEQRRPPHEGRIGQRNPAEAVPGLARDDSGEEIAQAGRWTGGRNCRSLYLQFPQRYYLKGKYIGRVA